MADSLYRNKSSLEAIFRILDKDNSGQISLEEFAEACHLLHKHLPEHDTEEDLLEMCKMMDINKDGLVDLNEFLEAFRLCDQARRGARGRALIIGESLSQDKSPSKTGAVTPLLGEAVPPMLSPMVGLNGSCNGNGGYLGNGFSNGATAALLGEMKNGPVITTSEVDTQEVLKSQGEEGDDGGSDESEDGVGKSGAKERGGGEVSRDKV